MLLGIDASRSAPTTQKTGVEKVSDELIKHIENIRTSKKFNFDVIYYTPKPIKWLPANKQKIIHFSRFWTVLGLSLEMLKNKPDALFVPVHALPFFAPQKTFHLIHDIEFKKNPHSYSFITRLYHNFIFWHSTHKSKIIFTMSEQTKKDILNNSKFKAEKISVIPHGYTKKNLKNKKNDLKDRKNQIIYLGRIEHKKNLINLIKSFLIFQQTQPEFKLILIGKPSFGAKQITKLAQKNKNIYFTGYLSEAEKNNYLLESKLLIHLSYQEGFCLPMLEAFDFNLPVIAANNPTLKFVGGEACYYTNGHQPKQVATDLKKIINNNDLAEHLSKKGQEQLKKYNWHQTAFKYLDHILNQ